MEGVKQTKSTLRTSRSYYFGGVDDSTFAWSRSMQKHVDLLTTFSLQAARAHWAYLIENVRPPGQPRPSWLLLGKCPIQSNLLQSEKGT